MSKNQAVKTKRHIVCGFLFVFLFFGFKFDKIWLGKVILYALFIFSINCEPNVLSNVSKMSLYLPSINSHDREIRTLTHTHNSMACVLERIVAEI